MCKIINIVVLSLFGLIVVSEGQIIQNGQCDANIQLQANFDFERFIQGTWYEFASTDHPRGGDCSTLEFTQVGNTNTVYNKIIKQNFFEDYHGTASVPAGSARLTLTMPTVSNTPINFWVWLTDYDNFALIYNCENVGTTQRRLYIWQLSKNKPYYDFEMMQVLMNNTMINTVGIDSNDLREIDHSDAACYELPIITPGQPIVLPGQCDENIRVVQNFNAGNFLGVWHQIYSYYSDNARGSCNRAQYDSEDGVVVDVVNSQVVNQRLSAIRGSATVVSTDGSGRLNVVLEVAPNVRVESELLIIATDYNQWAISYTCDNISNETRRVFSWIVSRTRTLPATAQAEVDAVVASIVDLNYAYYQPTDQSNNACFYIPDQADGNAIFGGQCDQNIVVQPNFVAGNYLGLWHDIESYSTPFQFGSCANAYYDLGEVGVDVLNTQVVNETLNTINGVAIPVGNEAKLVVSFPIEGTNLTTETDYWIIRTDYESYSLVYSCRNINDYQQQISMWKLSRTKALTPAANTAINTALANEAVFDERFFQPMDQSREGCFYYPEPIPGKPVKFPGQCNDEDIPVVQNFNFNLFDGQWFEVEAYPKEFQPGVCVNHQFSIASNTVLNLVSTSVADQLLDVSTSQLTLTNGTDARFTLTTSNGTHPIEFPYYIIDTDYINYALAYSCVNIDSDFKGIYSWKLSRSKELSSSSLVDINRAMEPITVLREDYFEPVDQSDSGCFYFPDLAPGELVVLPGQCDSDSVIPVMTNFDAESYLGRWRLIESYPSVFQTGDCNQARYSSGDNNTVIVLNSVVTNQTLRESTGVAVLTFDSNNQAVGKLLVTFPGSTVPFELWVLDTDYNNYALLYGCVNLGTQQRQVSSWKMSRTTNLTAEAIEAINAVTSNVTVLNDRYYETVDHSDAACFYYPELNPTSTVIFPGQCDENINVVTNFDAVGYMDLWHDIERYPAPFQDGTCGNAFYTLMDGPVVDVFNTQVLNQTLDTISGSAVLDLVDANDTSAKLLVTFPVGGSNMTTPYWVLATDYISYALVYSCTNIDTERRSVTSWKLSRTKALTPVAINAINAVVNRVDVLDDRYYLPQDQTREGCFYFPEPQPGEPVVFPGQCDINANVVQNFNLTAFGGIWHEIEAYPKEEEGGQCINHEFTLTSTNTMSFASSNVIAQSLGITSGTVRYAFNDNSGRFFLDFVSNGTQISIPYWIIDTDYENYALAYSCVNQNDDFRGVWSWKLSRTKQLSIDSRVAIDEAIADNVVLNNVYYEPIDQTDDACFYLPDTNPGEPAIFPGQCDTNIRGVANFNATAYLGLWRTIETYPSEFQLGECGDATYTFNDNGTVDVFNTEVINQALSTINGLAEVASTDGTGKLLVTFPTAPIPSEYYVLATDYENYALVYSCFNINSDQRRVYSWKLSRTNSLSEEAENAINAVVSQVNVLDSRYYEAVSRSDESCFYFPEPNGRPVVFRGQCDENIEVFMNFDATRYTGVWYDIESYPAPFQGGSCGTANYDLDLETLVVSVENTQVVDPDGFGPVLDVQTGTAVLALNDTSAKLLVTFEVGGVSITTDYWVLATDYVNYALVYSCQNLDNESRQVNSWKLSRTRSLAAVSEAAIAIAISRVQVLGQQYFEEGRQSEADCFFYPDNEGGDVVLDGLCVPEDQVPAITNFNANAFSGTWHEVARFPSDLQDGECTAAEYSVGTQNSISIAQTEVNNELQSAIVIPGTLAADGRGVIRAEIAGIPFNTFYVLDTDYSEFALLYGCRNIGNNTKQVYSWKFARSRSGLTLAANNRIDEVVRTNIDLYENYFSYTDQSNNACFHYPEFDELPDVIELPGPCDESIRGVSGFDAAAYLGRWIEIEKYPQSDQFGTCDRAYYSLGEDNVLVRNTQVVGETLAEQLGFAEVASDDGSGLLNVTFVVNGITVHANYYVLATDYVNYALVYSCRNLANGNRLVSSWKLGRTTTLNTQAIAAMDTMISQTQGLLQQYYQVTNQTEDACFYVPELNLDKAPVFRGQCDENVVGITDFDASRYAGWWHEIERYPVDNYRGECISSQYQASGNTYLVTDTVVANGTAAVSSGTVQITADGRLRRTINGQVQDIWVLATDYETYSLLYSCENADDTNEYRRIWSAKHSKVRQLTPAANAAMAPVIESNRLLYSQFYQEVDQSNAACFHYPAVTGQQIILPGQCDENIPVVQNFDVEAYGGTWYQIERYPQTHEDPTSTCIGARYTLDEASGVVTVLNWEILNGELMTIEGNATISSTDGSAKLSVVLPIRDSPTNETVTTSLYVLRTDYENYSLAYSCSNINPFQRSVGAWKLSRKRTLEPVHHEAINIHMGTREELHQPYFLSVEQDEECEEPSSGTFLRSSIIVMIICALWQILS